MILAQMNTFHTESLPNSTIQILQPIDFPYPLMNPILARGIFKSESGHVTLLKTPVVFHLIQNQGVSHCHALPRPWSLAANDSFQALHPTSLPLASAPPLSPSLNLSIPLSSEGLHTHHYLSLECSLPGNLQSYSLISSRLLLK